MEKFVFLLFLTMYRFLNKEAFIFCRCIFYLSRKLQITNKNIGVRIIMRVTVPSNHTPFNILHQCCPKPKFRMYQLFKCTSYKLPLTFSNFIYFPLFELFFFFQFSSYFSATSAKVLNRIFFKFFLPDFSTNFSENFFIFSKFD